MAMAKTKNKVVVTVLVLFVLYYAVVLLGSWIQRTVVEEMVGSWMGMSDDDRPTLRTGGRYLPKPPFFCPRLQKNVSCRPPPPPNSRISPTTPPPCPEYFRWIHEDLRPWKQTGITRRMVWRAGKTANFRLVILDGRMYVESYIGSFQTRDIFSLWSFTQLLRRHPDLPNLDLMFDCDDNPMVKLSDYYPNTNITPPPLFGYCKDDTTLNILFPDWSFWGWQETNIKPWVVLAKELHEGNEKTPFLNRSPFAYWKGNPHVCGNREELLHCNVTPKHDWNARLFVQDWNEEEKGGFLNSNLADQCKYRYKIFVEGWSYSGSQKYILSCDSLTLRLTARFDEFFTRGLVPLQHFWPVDNSRKCSSVKFAVDWGNANLERAAEIGRNGSRYMREDVKMDYVYDYMFHLLREYARLLRYTPRRPPNAVEVCADSMLCQAEGERGRRFMVDSQVDASKPYTACSLPPPFAGEEMESMKRKKEEAFKLVRSWEQKP